MIRPMRELKEFAKVLLEPGESREVSFTLGKRAFAHWNPAVHGWRVEDGTYAVQIGENARDICLEAKVEVEAEPIPPVGGYSLGMPMGEFSKSPKGRRFLDENIEHMIRGMAMAGFIPKEMLEMADRIPGGINLDVIDRIAEHAGNAAGGTGGLQVLMGQPLSILNNFLPEEKKEILADLLKELNG